MEFNHFLSAYYPDTSYGGDRLFADMLDQARQADRLGYASVSIPEPLRKSLLARASADYARRPVHIGGGGPWVDGVPSLRDRMDG